MELQQKNKLEYKGKLEAYQLYRGNTYTEYEKDNYNGYQNHLYKRALYGLSAFTQDEIATMCSKKKQRVNKVYMKGQNVINLYKQKVTNAYSNFIFKTLFPESPITQFFIETEETDVEFKNTLTFLLPLPFLHIPLFFLNQLDFHLLFFYFLQNPYI